MKKLFLVVTLVGLHVMALNGDSIKVQKKSDVVQKHVKEQMQREQKYAKEQKFYQGKDYNLSAVEVDPSDLDSIPTIEPENDFDMSDVYRDDI
ncbi:hypothetical protein [Sulfurimonas autotrophica]|uniref:Uncharacterized protein n=1 Tax=Sulfurimonas autotrophica (strain ATCC BAA-671 / DSM 16294 / JCM 11897 / OK10) TaxID=563040 RepID=E0URJ0_SULAO|nr:hypothetical protein [Sulfurimonas autotrophica]ADN10076.1 hypothetical protein Saut_2033 [Sulfurimonas autotrophica DSM 16294]